MKKNIVGKLITIFAIISATIEIGIAVGYYMLVNIDFDKYNSNYTIDVLR